MASQDTKYRFAGVLVLIVLALGFGIIMATIGGPTPPNWTTQTFEDKQRDGLQLIQDRFAPSDYALDRLPAAIAAGEWSSSRNLWDCNNPNETNCIEVDFKMSSVNVECKWLVSYDRETADLLSYRPLNDAALNLFTEVAGSNNTGPVNYAGKIFVETQDGSTTSDAIRLVKNDYVPKDPTLYSGSQADWIAEKKNTLNNGDDVIAVRFVESKADTPSEWIVELSPGIHDRYKLIRTNSEVLIDFVPKRNGRE